MNVQKIIGIALLAGGLIALYFGLNAANSIGGELSEAVTGQYSDRTMLYLIGGGIASAVGLVMVIRK